MGNRGDSGAGGVFLYQSSPVITSSIIAFSSIGGAVLCDTGSENPTITQCVVYANVGGDSLCGNHYDNAYVDPLLCDVLYDDLTLCADSPCLPGATWPERVGAHDQGCGACGSAVQPATWGRIKSLYRQRAVAGCKTGASSTRTIPPSQGMPSRITSGCTNHTKSPSQGMLSRDPRGDARGSAMGRSLYSSRGF